MQNQPGLLFVVQQKRFGAVGIVCVALFSIMIFIFSVGAPESAALIILGFSPFVLLGVWVLMMSYVWKLWVYTDRFVLRTTFGKIKTVFFTELTSVRTEVMRGGLGVFANGRRAFDISAATSNYGRVLELLDQISDNSPFAVATATGAPLPPGARQAVSEYVFNNSAETRVIPETVSAKPGWGWSLFLIMTLLLPVLAIPELPGFGPVELLVWLAFVLVSAWFIGYSFVRKITIERDGAVRYRRALWVWQRCYLNDFSEIRLVTAQNELPGQTAVAQYILFFRDGKQVYRVASHYRGFSDLKIRLEREGWI